MPRKFVASCLAVTALAMVLGGLSSLKSEEDGAVRPGPSGIDDALLKLAENSLLTAPGLLSEVERQFLQGQADGQIRDNVKDKVYRTQVQMLPEKGSKKILVTHYRYKNDETIRQVIDVDTKKVVKIEKVAHMPTPLAQEELARARKLALANPELKKYLEPYGDKLKIDALCPRVPEGAPGHGHRLADLIFRVDGDFLSGPRVTVDLTDGKARFQLQ